TRTLAPVRSVRGPSCCRSASRPSLSKLPPHRPSAREPAYPPSRFPLTDGQPSHDQRLATDAHPLSPPPPPPPPLLPLFYRSPAAPGSNRPLPSCMRTKAAPMVTMASNGSVCSLVVPASQTYEENGRLYHGFRRGLYMYPCDESEKDRMDIYHQLFIVARRGHLHQTPIPQHWSPRILDLGCGTGIWAIDMADKYLNSEVYGLDLVNIQPEKIPPNLRFRVPRDYESPWALGEESFDLIHLRMACGSITSWPEMYQKVFTHLKPGSGWIEHVEIDLEPRCDDGTLSQDSHITQWYNYLKDATARVDRPIAYDHRTRQLLQAAGFIDIQETIIRAPYNTWAADDHQKDIGRWYNLGLTEGLEALSAAPFTRVNRWDMNEHVKPLVEAPSHQFIEVTALIPCPLVTSGPPVDQVNELPPAPPKATSLDPPPSHQCGTHCALLTAALVPLGPVRGFSPHP
ncbi:hypothetical protein GRF29_164g301573, partial [Pseudopithomyces chartarum]